LISVWRHMITVVGDFAFVFDGAYDFAGLMVD
jgi:hypothetical protein